MESKETYDKKIAILKAAFLASYNEDRPEYKQIANEFAPEIWVERAKTILKRLNNA